MILLHQYLKKVRINKWAEDYLELVRAVEATASSLGLPVIIEGEPPPRDPRLNKPSVTPDPGFWR